MFASESLSLFFKGTLVGINEPSLMHMGCDTRGHVSAHCVPITAQPSLPEVSLRWSFGCPQTFLSHIGHLSAGSLRWPITPIR